MVEEKALVEKLKGWMRSWLKDVYEKAKPEWNYEDELEELAKAKTLKELTGWARERAWKAIDWAEKILEAALEPETNIEEILRFDTGDVYFVEEELIWNKK